jgi:hypothetical protein
LFVCIHHMGDAKSLTQHTSLPPNPLNIKGKPHYIA